MWMIANESDLARVWMTQGKPVSISTKTPQTTLSHQDWAYKHNCSELWLIMYEVPTRGFHHPPCVSTCSSNSHPVLKLQAPEPTPQSSWFRIIVRKGFLEEKEFWNPLAGMAPENASNQGGASKWEQAQLRGAPMHILLDVSLPDLPPSIHTGQKQTVNLYPVLGVVQKFPFGKVCYFQIPVLNH